MKNILFLCTGNSCRSQMAEGFARQQAPVGTAVYSAGIEKHGLDPRAVRVMAEIGVDISNQWSKTVNGIPAECIDTVITLCGQAAETCPAFLVNLPGAHWSLPDPARAEGTEMEVLAVFRRVRDEIQRRVAELFAC